MQIGELSRRSGVSVRMLRYYEQAGLLNPARTPAGYRAYGDADEQTVRRIRMLGSAGLTLDAIQEVLSCVRSDAPDYDPCPRLLAGLRRQVDALTAKLAELAATRELLADYLHALEQHAGPAGTGATPDR